MNKSEQGQQAFGRDRVSKSKRMVKGKEVEEEKTRRVRFTSCLYIIWLLEKRKKWQHNNLVGWLGLARVDDPSKK